MAANRCFYDVLKLARAASQNDIKAAYRKAALRLHPDLHQDAAVRFATRRYARARLLTCPLTPRVPYADGALGIPRRTARS